MFEKLVGPSLQEIHLLCISSPDQGHGSKECISLLGWYQHLMETRDELVLFLMFHWTELKVRMLGRNFPAAFLGNCNEIRVFLLPASNNLVLLPHFFLCCFKYFFLFTNNGLWRGRGGESKLFTYNCSWLLYEWLLSSKNSFSVMQSTQQADYFG